MADCSTCQSRIVPGSMFCDSCGASQSNVKVARKLRQSSFSQVKNAGAGLLAPGEQIKAGGKTYIIEEAIARSGFGATFRAIRKNDKKQVLIKQMLDQSSYDQFKTQLMASFKREAKFLRRIKHPAYPRGFQYFQKHGSFYLVMEFINGKELAKAIADYREDKGKVPDGLVVYLGIEIAEAMQVLHDSGYIYRDLKPQNVMLDGISGKVKLIDFGTLYHRSDKDPLVFESAGYTPPEFLDATQIFKPSGDIFSLGALLYEAATGTTPSHGDFSELRSQNRDKRLVAIIEKCLDLDPSKRFQKAKEVRNALLKLTKKGWWLFRNSNHITPEEISVLPKTLYPPACTFCDYCGFADANSHAGYCPKCRIPMKVGRLTWKLSKKDKGEQEFYLYADDNKIGLASGAQVSLKDVLGPENLGNEHARISRHGNALWLEAVKGHEHHTRVNGRRVYGKVELLEGDIIHVGNISLYYHIQEAC